MLRSAILGDYQGAREMYDAYLKIKPLPYYPVPSKMLLAKFVEQDYKRFNVVLRKECDKYFDYLANERIGRMTPIKEWTQEKVVISPYGRFGNRSFPMSEAVLAKLAFLGGADIQYDSDWLPKGYSTAIMNAG